MITSSCFLYAMRRLRLISFSTDDPKALTDSSKTLVSIKALINTSPLSLTYLIYMVIMFSFIDVRSFLVVMPIPSLGIINCSHAFVVSLKASLNGVCSGRKCSNVYNLKKNYSCIYNDNRVLHGEAEIF